MPDFIKTSKPRTVGHSHRDVTEGELSAVGKGLGLQLVKQFAKSGFKLINGATMSYNCFANAFANNHGWITNPDIIIADDFEGVPLAQAQMGDVVVYLKDVLLTHCATVVEIEDGQIKRVKGKWGAAPEIEHLLREVPPEYGEPSILLRRVRPTTTQEEDAATEGEGTTDSTVTEDETPEAPVSLANLIEDDELRTRLMLASSDEVRDRIFRAQVVPSAGGTSALAALAPPLPADGIVSEDEPPTSAPPNFTQEEIDGLLKALVDDQVVRAEPMLASTPNVARRIIAAGAQVKQLISRTEGAQNGPARAAVGAAALKLFNGHQPQPDDWLDRILLFILVRCPVREAAPPLSQYLLTGQPVGLARTLALEAFAVAIIS